MIKAECLQNIVSPSLPSGTSASLLKSRQHTGVS